MMIYHMTVLPDEFVKAVAKHVRGRFVDKCMVPMSIKSQDSLTRRLEDEFDLMPETLE
jgi:hypothetical protein